MAILVRFVRGSDFFAREQWQSEEAVPSEVLKHFRDKGGATSLYALASEEDLETLVAAYALGNRENLRKYDVFYVDELKVLEDFALQETQGYLPDDEVNGWHRECPYASDNELRHLVFLFSRHGSIKRYSLAEVRAFVCNAVTTRPVHQELLSEGVGRDLEKAMRNQA